MNKKELSDICTMFHDVLAAGRWLEMTLREERSLKRALSRYCSENGTPFGTAASADPDLLRVKQHRIVAKVDEPSTLFDRQGSRFTKALTLFACLGWGCDAPNVLS